MGQLILTNPTAPYVSEVSEPSVNAALELLYPIKPLVVPNLLGEFATICLQLLNSSLLCSEMGAADGSKRMTMLTVIPLFSSSVPSR